MSDNTTDMKQKPAPPNALDIIADTMVEFRDEMEFFNNEGGAVAKKTRRIILMGFTALGISSIFLVFMIVKMADGMATMTTHLEDMYNNFGSMSDDMKQITHSVDLMGNDISGVALIAESTSRIDGDVGSMRASIQSMNQSIHAIDNDMTGIGSNMHQMAGRLSNVNHAVNAISYDVEDMSSPMNSGPMEDFWPGR